MPGHALDVVDGVAHQREHVHDLLRRDAEFLLHARRVVPGAFFLGVVDLDAVAHQLKEILVAGDDDHFEAGRRRLHGQRPDDVVGFVALRCEDRHAERFAGGVDHRDLLGELVGHRRAVRLVVGDQVVAERAPRQIERRRDVLRLLLVEQLAQHRHEDVDGVGRPSLRVAKESAFGRAHRRVIRAVHLGAAVDQEESLTLVNSYHSRDALTHARGPARHRAGGAHGRAAAAARSARPATTEYEEDLTLSMDGSAALVVNASILALDALQGAVARPDPAHAPISCAMSPRLLSSPYRRASAASAPGRARGRRFVGMPVVPTFASCRKAAPFAWAAYELHAGRRAGDLPARPVEAARAATPARRLRGDEIVAFRLHLPARIRFQNSRYLDRDESRPASRGNIITWEQRLDDRLQGQPIAYAEDKTPDVMEVRMDRESILYRTLWLFGVAFAAALLVLAGLIWLTMRRGATTRPSSGPASVFSPSLIDRRARSASWRTFSEGTPDRTTRPARRRPPPPVVVARRQAADAVGACWSVRAARCGATAAASTAGRSRTR